MCDVNMNMTLTSRLKMLEKTSYCCRHRPNKELIDVSIRVIRYRNLLTIWRSLEPRGLFRNVLVELLITSQGDTIPDHGKDVRSYR